MSDPVLLVDNTSTENAEILPTNAKAMGGTTAMEEYNSLSAATDVPSRGSAMHLTLTQ
jgi:hypothetical protein